MRPKGLVDGTNRRDVGSMWGDRFISVSLGFGGLIFLCFCNFGVRDFVMLNLGLDSIP